MGTESSLDGLPGDVVVFDLFNFFPLFFEIKRDFLNAVEFELIARVWFERLLNQFLEQFTPLLNHLCGIIIGKVLAKIIFQSFW